MGFRESAQARHRGEEWQAGRPSPPPAPSEDEPDSPEAIGRPQRTQVRGKTASRAERPSFEKIARVMR